MGIFSWCRLCILTMSNFASFFGSLILKMQAHKEIEIEPIVPQERLSTNANLLHSYW